MSSDFDFSDEPRRPRRRPRSSGAGGAEREFLTGFWRACGCMFAVFLMGVLLFIAAAIYSGAHQR